MEPSQVSFDLSLFLPFSCGSCYGLTRVLVGDKTFFYDFYVYECISEQANF